MTNNTQTLDSPVLITHAKIYVEKNVFADSILIGEDGIIRAVGTEDDIVGEYGCPDTVIKAQGATIVPGFNDSHMHLLNTGIALNAVRLQTAQSVDEVIERGKQYIKDKNPPAGSVIYGMGWNQDHFKEHRLLNRDDLDKISTTYPIIFVRACGHIIVCNSKALEMAGVDGNTIPAEGGALDKDEHGRLTGIARENARDQIRWIMAEQPVEEKVRLIQIAVDYANKCGITSVQTCDVRNRDWQTSLEAYDEFFATRIPTIRVSHQFSFMKPEPLKSFLASERATKRNDPFNQLGALKLFADGSLGARTALMRKPYHDDPENTGIATLTQEEIEVLTKMAQDSGFPTVVHAIGDGAIENVLNAFENVLKPDNPLRCGIIHVQITDRALLERFAKQNILAFVQPIFIHYDSTIVNDRVGDEMAATSYNFHTLQELGVHTSLGTDSPVEDMNPLENLYCAVTRKRLRDPEDEPYNPDEKMEIQEAVDAYTYESAYATAESSRKGRLKPGYVADLVLLDKDIFTENPEELLKTSVLATMVNGRFVYWQPQTQLA
ncbi:MAG: amidohydrolase [Burkholderiales bacterium]|nr:amidohydrolase [Burkholderiales bacterium]